MAPVVSSTVQLSEKAPEAAGRGARVFDAAWAKYAPVAEQISERTRATVAERRRLIESITDKALRASVE